MYGEKLAEPMTTIVLRPSNIYGPYDDYDPATSHVTAALIRKVVERQSPIEVWGTGEDVRDVIHVDDMIDAMVMSVEKLDAYTALNIGLGRGYSVKEILGTLLEIDGYGDAVLAFDPSKPSMIPVRLVDPEKAAAEMGFRARLQDSGCFQRSCRRIRCVEVSCRLHI
ncbi:NAD-dependent epimerase/dehydratase family protein [Candidatus Sumerlaeota bacterium]|nr:NAD-dependent epimerase/dehydratase family protein [Candidatus Sumerlaeota bacterium]